MITSVSIFIILSVLLSILVFIIKLKKNQVSDFRKFIYQKTNKCIQSQHLKNYKPTYVITNDLFKDIKNVYLCTTNKFDYIISSILNEYDFEIFISNRRYLTEYKSIDNLSEVFNLFILIINVRNIKIAVVCENKCPKILEDYYESIENRNSNIHDSLKNIETIETYYTEEPTATSLQPVFFHKKEYRKENN